MGVPSVIPTLRKSEITAWQLFDRLDERTLYAVVGASPGLDIPLQTGDSLVIGTLYNITKQAVERGKRAFRLKVHETRARVCPKWTAFKLTNRRKLRRIEVFALILECVVASAGVHVWPPPVATATLICKACGYNMNKLCRKPSPAR